MIYRKDICNTVLLRPTPPGPLPVAACDSYENAARIASELNMLCRPELSFTAQYPKALYSERTKKRILAFGAFILYTDLATLPNNTQNRIYQAFSRINPSPNPR